ncbi:Histone-lysine N-methyltransferase 2A, partial [Geodia barretti]
HPFLSREAARAYRGTVAAAKVTNTPTSSLSILFSAYHTPSAPARKITAHSWNNGSEQGGEKDADVRHRQPQEAGRVLAEHDHQPHPQHLIFRIPTASDLPMAMRYRVLQKTYKQMVGVYQSYIHGLGLFCRRDIEAGEMVIEYAGTVIRSVLTDKREKMYDAKGIGCYMFRIDADDVVGATMSGNEARFINHSCEVSTSISLLASKNLQKKIMIFALRRSATHQLYYILQTRLDWHMCI